MPVEIAAYLIGVLVMFPVLVRATDPPMMITRTYPVTREPDHLGHAILCAVGAILWPVALILVAVFGTLYGAYRLLRWGKPAPRED